MAGEYYTGRPLIVMKAEILMPGFYDGIIRDTVHNCISVAMKLNVVVRITINEVQLDCDPGDDLDAKMDALTTAFRMGWKSVV